MKALTKTLLLVAMFITTFSTLAQDFKVNGIYYNITDADALTVEVTDGSFNSYTGEVIIPKTVTFNGNTFSVTKIGYGAAWNCTDLLSITIPNSVTEITDGAFSGCSGLTTIVVEEGNTVYDSRDNCNAIIETKTNTLIFGCQNTIIPNSVTTIGECAFDGCSGLSSITIPNSVTEIGSRAFSECSALSSITIPNSVTEIGDLAFSRCPALTSITIPNSVTKIGDGAFFECSGLSSVTISNSVTTIGDFAFYGCSGLTAITIPNSVTEIGSRAFFGCTGLSSVTIPNSVTTIGECAFQNCASLTSIVIPKSVIYIGESAFGWCNNLSEIISLNPVPLEFDDYYYFDVNYENCILKVPVGSKEAYANALEWSKFKNIVEYSDDVNQ